MPRREAHRRALRTEPGWSAECKRGSAQNAPCEPREHRQQEDSAGSAAPPGNQQIDREEPIRDSQKDIADARELQEIETELRHLGEIPVQTRPRDGAPPSKDSMPARSIDCAPKRERTAFAVRPDEQRSGSILSMRTLSGQHDPHRLAKDEAIQEQGMVLDVVEVVLQLLHRIVDRRSRTDSAPAPIR